MDVDRNVETVSILISLCLALFNLLLQICILLGVSRVQSFTVTKWLLIVLDLVSLCHDMDSTSSLILVGC